MTKEELKTWRDGIIAGEIVKLYPLDGEEDIFLRVFPIRGNKFGAAFLGDYEPTEVLERDQLFPVDYKVEE
jgi:hypothetical protein